MQAQSGRYLERTVTAVAGEQIKGRRVVMASTGENGTNVEGHFYHQSFGRWFVPMGVALWDAEPGEVFTMALPGQVVELEAADAGRAGTPVGPLPGPQADGRVNFVDTGDIGTGVYWVGIALDASEGEGDVVRVWFWPFGGFVGSESAPVEG